MYSIEIREDEKIKLLKYISFSIENIIDNKNFFILEDNQPNNYLILPSYNEFYFNFNNNKIKIIYKEEGKPKSLLSRISYFSRLTIYHEDLNILKEFIKNAIDYKEIISDNQITIYTSKIKGYWEKYNNINVQSIDNIFIDSKIKNSIINDIDNFFNLIDKYNKFGRTHKYNILLYGIQGSGKTSLAKALAQKYKYTLYIINLNKSLTDDNFIDLISNIKGNAIILYEDIDTFFNNRSSINSDISYSCITNILDGALSRGNSTISILTANNINFLDKPFLRQGRIDKIIKFDYPKKEQIKEVFEKLINNNSNDFENFYNKIKSEKITMSGIVDYLFNNPTSFIDNINNLIKNNKIINDEYDIYI